MIKQISPPKNDLSCNTSSKIILVVQTNDSSYPYPNGNMPNHLVELDRSEEIPFP